MTEHGWIYCRLVDRGGLLLPGGAMWIGPVELSNRSEAASEVRGALRESMEAFVVSEPVEEWRRLASARVLVPAATREEAIRVGAFHVNETVEMYNLHAAIGLGELRLTDAGYVQNLESRESVPLLPPRPERNFSGTSAMIDDVAHHPFHTLSTLLAAPAAFGQLGEAFRRSSHWQALAKRADRDDERLLFFWMAAECVAKVREDEEVMSKLLAACGFPVGRLLRSISSSTAEALAGVRDYKIWRKRLEALFEQMRIARNGIVHSGFRHVDLPAMFAGDDLRLGMRALTLGARQLASMALQGVNLGVTTIDAMWPLYERLFEGSGVVRHAEWVIERLQAA